MRMEKFGIEVRRVGDFSNFYKDVDLILKKYNVPSRGISKDLQANGVVHALQKMLSSDWHFSVCTIESCAKLCGIYIPIDRMRLYNTVHCVHWNEMLPDFRSALIAMIFDDFREVLNPEEENIRSLN